MSVLLSPIGNGINFLTTTGQPLNAGQLYTYQAGSSTPLTTYSDNNGLYPNSNPIILGTDGRLPNELWLTQNYYYKFVLEDSNNNLIATYDNLYGILATSSGGGSTSVPSGVIMMWSGSIGSIPSGYYLCNGSNGTPDLRDRFIVGAGNLYSVAQTGGSADAIVVSHTHTANSVTSVTDPGHSHSIPLLQNINAYGSNSGAVTPATPGNVTTNTAFTGISATTNTTIAVAGNAGTGANNPLFYALCYIMKS